MPGKFEGEPDYVRHFWGMALDGEADERNTEGDDTFYIFRISSEDARRWRGSFAPFVTGDHLVLWEDEQGFVNSIIERRGANQ